MPIEEVSSRETGAGNPPWWKWDDGRAWLATKGLAAVPMALEWAANLPQYLGHLIVPIGSADAIPLVRQLGGPIAGAWIDRHPQLAGQAGLAAEVSDPELPGPAPAFDVPPSVADKVVPWRGDGREYPKPDIEAAAAAVREAVRGMDTRAVQSIEGMREALRWWRSPVGPPGPIAGGIAISATDASAATIDWLFATIGPAATLEAWLRSALTLRSANRLKPFNPSRPRYTPLRALRRNLASCDEASWLEAMRYAERAVAIEPKGMTGTLASIFPSRSDWWAEGSVPGIIHLPPDEAVQRSRGGSQFRKGHNYVKFAPPLVARWGPEAAPLIVEGLSRVDRDGDLAAMAMWARWLNVPEIDKAMEPFSDSPAIIPDDERPTLAEALTDVPGDQEAISTLADADETELADLRGRMKAAPLARLAWAVFTAWEKAGHNLEQAGPLRALEHVGNASLVKRLGDRILWWRGEPEDRIEATRVVYRALKERLKREKEAKKRQVIKPGTTLRTQAGPALTLDFAPSGEVLVLGDDAGARIHRVTDGGVDQELHSDGPASVARFGSDGAWVALGTQSGVSRIALDEGSRLLFPQNGPIICLDWALDDAVIVALGPCELVAWDARSIDWLSREEFTEPATALGREPGGYHMFVGQESGRLVAHLIGEHSEIDDLELDGAVAVISSPYGSGPLTVGFADGEVIGLSLHTCRSEWSVDVNGFPRIARSRNDSRLLVTGSETGEPLLLVDPASGRVQQTLPPPVNQSGVRCLALGPDGRSAAIGFSDGEVVLMALGK